MFMQLACGTATPLWGVNPTPTINTNLSYNSTINTPASPEIPTTTRVSITPVVTNYPTSTPISLDPTPTVPALNATIESTSTSTPGPAPLLYYAQSGDTIPALAKRFKVSESQITSNETILDPSGLINPGTLILLPDEKIQNTTPNIQTIPDSEIIFSASASNFDYAAYIKSAGGRLSTHREYLSSTGWVNGAQVIEKAAYENSINPRILLAVLEYESRWVSGAPIDSLHEEYPMGYVNLRYKNAFMQTVWAVNQLSIGYYGWRDGSLTELEFLDGTKLRIDPRLNAGTVAIQYLFSRVHSQSQWSQIINPTTGFPALYTKMFDDPWARADLVNPIFPAGITQPEMTLPFENKIEWSYTGGPHGAWEHDGALAAIDFAPITDHGGCDTTKTWVLASAPGLVVRSDDGVVVIDLDGDGFEQTGWNLMHLHIATKDRARVGTWLETNDRIGHASCEGGVSTGTHLHFARKYNGEWITADGPMPFTLDEWIAQAGKKPYEGLLIKGNQTVKADPNGQAWSQIYRGLDGTPTPKP